MKKLEPWEELTRQLEASLADGASHSEPVIEAEEHLDVGAVSLDIVVEASGPSEAEQRIGFAAICDLLRTRLQQGSSQVLGCLLIDGEPNASAFASGLEGMRSEDGFTPVIPVTRDRARVAFTTGAPRSASIVASSDAVVLAIGPKDLEQMRSEAPALAIQTSDLVASRLAQRLAATSRVVRSLSS